MNSRDRCLASLHHREPDRVAFEPKRDFDKDLVFWGGGVDTQGIFTTGSPQEIRDHVKENIEALAPGGGFVFATIHNTQANVPPRISWPCGKRFKNMVYKKEYYQLLWRRSKNFRRNPDAITQKMKGDRRVKNRGQFVGILLTVFLVMALAGASSAQAQKKMSVLTWNIPYYEEGFKKWVTEFNKKHPDIQIERLDKKGTEWSTFYQTQVVAGTAPDIIDIQGALWLEYASKGGLLDLTPYMKKEPELAKQFYPEVLKSWVYEGKQYALPFIISKTLLFYNKNMLKEAGVKDLPKNFEELMASARKMTKGEKSGFMTLNFDWLYWPLFAMNGIELLSPDQKKAAFNTPQAVKAVETLAKATQDGVINKISWTGRWVEPNDAFAAGTVGMFHAHAPAFLWFKSKAPWVSEETVGAAHLPGGWSTPNSHSILISKSCKYPDAAWDMLKIIATGDGAYALGTGTNNLTGNIEANKRLLEYFGKTLPVAVPALKTQLEHLDKLCGNWPLAKDAEVKEAFYPELQNALLGRKSAKDALADAEKKVNRILQPR